MVAPTLLKHKSITNQMQVTVVNIHEKPVFRIEGSPDDVFVPYSYMSHYRLYLNFQCTQRWVVMKNYPSGPSFRTTSDASLIPVRRIRFSGTECVKNLSASYSKYTSISEKRVSTYFLNLHILFAKRRADV